MKTINKIFAALIAVSGLFCVSCNDAIFLEEKAETFYTVDNIFSSSEQVNQVLTTCYHRVRNMYCPYNNSSELDTWNYSMGNGTDLFDVPTFRYSYRFNDYSIINPQSNFFKSVFCDFYYLINSANTAIYLADNEDIKWESEEKKAYIIAQARFFRAFAYRNLGELFGGVPIVTEPTDEPRYDYERATRMETYDFAIKEMEAIVGQFPVTTNEAGRLVKGAVQHNLCQLYLSKGLLCEKEGGDAKAAYQKALSYANDVIDGGTYHLMTERFGTRMNEDPEFYCATSRADQAPENSYTALGYHIDGNVYWDLWQIGNQDYQNGNFEAIWVAQSDYDLWKTAERNNNRYCLDYPGIYGPVFRDQASKFVNGNLEDVGGFGMSQICPTDYLRDGIYRDKWADDMRNSEAVFHRIIIGSVKSSPFYGRPVPWDEFYRVDENGKPDDAAYTALYPFSCKIGPDKYAMKEMGSNLRSIFRDDYLIRLPETILLRAEIKMRLGDNGGAANDINMLRTRSQCSYLVTSGDISMDLILDERARELIYEESRWNTLLRISGEYARERVRKYAYWDYSATFANATWDVWPIPQSVIDTNKDVEMKQNPGW